MFYTSSWVSSPEKFGSGTHKSSPAGTAGSMHGLKPTVLRRCAASPVGKALGNLPEPSAGPSCPTGLSALWRLPRAVPVAAAVASALLLHTRKKGMGILCSESRCSRCDWHPWGKLHAQAYRVRYVPMLQFAEAGEGRMVWVVPVLNIPELQRGGFRNGLVPGSFYFEYWGADNLGNLYWACASRVTQL